MEKVYRTVRAARAALTLDCGFDPFLSGGWGRATKARLAEAGYLVDPQEWAIRQEEGSRHICRECGAKAMVGYRDNLPTGYCAAHTPWDRVCDNGHRWTATDAEDKQNGHPCPVCGECWV